MATTMRIRPVPEGATEREFARNLFDRIAAAAGLLLLAPVLMALAVAIWIEDGHPVLFRQTRMGRGNRPFALIKFRSMRKGSTGLKLTAASDPRITRAGRLLRRFKLDELPQLWNVLRGDMALVGPRPEVPEYIDAADPVWRAVLARRPGITDLASLVYRNEEDILAAADDPERHYREAVLPRKLALNLSYSRSTSLARDLKLIAWTIRYSFIPSGFDAAAVERSFSPKVPS